MKSIAVSLLAVALASTLAACTPPEDAQKTAEQPAPVAEAPAVETPAVETPAEPAAPTITALRALDEAEAAESLIAAKNCNLESVDGVAFSGTDISPATPMAVKATGWLKSGDADAVADQLTLRFESADKTRLWEIPVAATIARDDLSSAAADKGTPGFEVEFDASALPAGRYHLYLSYRVGGVLTGCDNGRHIAIL